MQRGFVLCTKNVDNVDSFQQHRSREMAIKKKAERERDNVREGKFAITLKMLL